MVGRQKNAKGNAMELYYKDLISEDASLEKLVDDLMLLVQGANELAEAAGANLAPEQREEIRTRLARLRDGCLRVKRQMIASALATDKLFRQYPYSTAGFVFAFGLLAGFFAARRYRARRD
jgi:ElaB/YqjD/DUF883 family membrane-anchored ribosome-binding protein